MTDYVVCTEMPQQPVAERDHDLDLLPCRDPSRCCTPRAHGSTQCTFFDDAVYAEAERLGWRPSDQAAFEVEIEALS